MSFLRYGNLYTEENVAISGIHTHAGPGGYLQYLIYSITSLGFVQQSFDAIVTAIEQSIVMAHNSLKPGSILMNTGDYYSTSLESINVSRKYVDHAFDFNVVSLCSVLQGR